MCTRKGIEKASKLSETDPGSKTDEATDAAVWVELNDVESSGWALNTRVSFTPQLQVSY